MKILHSIWKELKTIIRTAAYFAVVFILLMAIKTLLLKDYNIEFSGMGQALIGALILSKVIILMELIRPAKWVQRQPPVVYVVLRTLLYSAGVLFVSILEKGFEKRHEHAGFSNAVLYVIQNRDMYHVWATTIGVSASIFIYNAFFIIQKAMGPNALRKLFFSIPMDQAELVAPLSVLGDRP